ncbi:hypothetical protein [Vibrio parahaemolyticus]|uniref:hypothetical protein n=1 Tax=Vibrio parahaemolyticus TaxID=670 RepID=UPI001E357102|nr:hypothetical protein [Vibrio parahaemolyticus]MCD2151972.1 hypothetical protein [Vibrio parahaemolyticus]HCJ4668904.1 hypothetical protein [Vibrio parahaemolyticus]
MKKPTIESSQEELIAFVRDWIDLCASGEAEYAFSFLDEPLDNSRSKWSLEDFEMVRFDHFGDNQLPVITSPLTVTGVSETTSSSTTTALGGELSMICRLMVSLVISRCFSTS